MKLYTILLTLLLTACSGDTQEAKPDSSNIMVNGDSFEAWDDGNWPTMLNKISDSNIYNFSKGSRTLRQIEERFASDYVTIEPKPDVVLIAAGINDVSLRYSLESMQVSVLSIIDMLPEETTVVLFDSPPFKSSPYWTQVKQDDADAYDEWIVALSKTSENIKIFSYKSVLDKNNDGVLDIELDDGDGIHPNAEIGHALISESINKFLKN